MWRTLTSILRLPVTTNVSDGESEYQSTNAAMVTFALSFLRPKNKPNREHLKVLNIISIQEMRLSDWKSNSILPAIHVA